MPELEHLSYSSISTYLLCARAWRYHYMDKVTVPTAPTLLFGSAWHSTVEGYLRSGGDLPALWHESWGAQRASAPNVAWTAQQSEAALNNEGLRMAEADTVRKTLAGIQVANDDSGPRIERRVDLRVPGVPIPILGYIDLITNDGVPCDLKTAAHTWTEDKQLAETQPLFYLAALNQAGEHAHHWRFRHYVFVKGKTPQVQVLDHVYRPAELFWLFDLIVHVWRGIDAGVYPPNPGSWKCSPIYCDYYDRCRGR